MASSVHKRTPPELLLRLLLPHKNDNTIGPDIFIEDLSVSKGNNSVHFSRHLFYTQKNELLACNHVVETCPHVFITQSTILAIIYVDSYTFSHHLLYQSSWAGIIQLC